MCIANQGANMTVANAQLYEELKNKLTAITLLLLENLEVGKISIGKAKNLANSLLTLFPENGTEAEYKVGMKGLLAVINQLSDTGQSQHE